MRRLADSRSKLPVIICAVLLSHVRNATSLPLSNNYCPYNSLKLFVEIITGSRATLPV